MTTETPLANHFIRALIREVALKATGSLQMTYQGRAVDLSQPFARLTIREAIVEITEYGGAPMSPAIARKTLRLLGQRKQQEPAGQNHTIFETLLTDREREVLQHMINGYDAKRIAELTGISTLTVRKHIANVYTKLHVNSRAQVISMAHKYNWTNSPE